MQGVPFNRIRKISEKSHFHSAKKKPKGGPFGLASTFGSLKNIVVQRENQTRSPASQKFSWANEQKIVKNGPFRVRL